MKIKAIFKRYLPNNSSAKNVTLLVGGTAGAQLLGVIFAPILTRLYATEDYGMLAIYASLLSIFSITAGLRYELAIPIPKDDREAACLVILGIIITATSTIAIAFIIWIGSEKIANLFNLTKFRAYLWLLPLGVFFGGIYNIARYWCIRKKKFDAVAKTTIHQALASIFIQLAGYKFGGVSLLFAQAASQSVGAFTLSKHYTNSQYFTRLTCSDIKYTAIKYKRFPLYSTWEGLFNTAGNQLPPLLLAALFNTSTAGIYNLANRVLSIPMSLIGNAIGQVFLSNAAEARRNGDIGILVLKLHTKLAQLGLAPVLLLAIAGPEIFSLAFGSSWEQAGEFARWMAPWLYLVLSLSPLSTIFTVMQCERKGLAFQIILLLSRLSTLIIGSIYFDITSTIIIFSLASAICWFGLLFWIGDASGNSYITMLKPTLSAILPSVICSLPLLAGLYSNSIINHGWLYGFAISCLIISVRCVYILRKEK